MTYTCLGCGFIVHADREPHPGEVDLLCRACWRLATYGEGEDVA